MIANARPKDTTAWRIFRLRTGREGAVAEAMVHKGLPAYSPHEHRRERVKASRLYPDGLRVTSRPLMPGYGFVLCSDAGLEVPRAHRDALPSFSGLRPGFARLLTPIERRIVYALMASELAKLFDQREKENEFKPGQLVKVVVAQYEGGDLDVVAKVIKAKSTDERIQVLMECFGTERQVDVSVDKVSAA